MYDSSPVVKDTTINYVTKEMKGNSFHCELASLVWVLVYPFYKTKLPC